MSRFTRKHFILFGFGFLSLCLLGSNGKGLAACPGDPSFDRSSVFHLVSIPIQPRYFHDHSTAQIEAMRHAKFRSRAMHNPGLTLAEEELSKQFEIGGIRSGRRGGCCVWINGLTINFSYHRMDVYVSSQYPELSCPYKVILGHENQHVAINQRVLDKYFALMRQAMAADRSLPTKANPLAVRSMNEGRTAVMARLNRVLNPIFARYKNELMVENGKIDTLENYKRTQAQCKDWR